MRPSRSLPWTIALWLCLAALACGSSTGSASAPPDATSRTTDAGSDAAAVPTPEDPTRFETTGRMSKARFGHTANLLPDGRVIVIGGETTSTPALAIEAYDPAAGTWHTLGELSSKRENHTTTLLADGRLLVVGGGASNDVGAPAGKDVLATTLLVDPSNGSVTEGGKLHAARSHHAATLLRDGRVLVVGGCSDAHTQQPDFGDAIASVEIYDPKSDTWAEAAPIEERRFLHTISALGSGQLVVVGGSDETERELPVVEMFDPASGAWSTGPNLGVSRVFHAAAALDDGSVFVTAGKLANKRFLESSEILDERGAAWSKGPDLETARTAPALTKLASGRLALSGGLYGSLAGFKVLADAHIYDPETKKWTDIGSMKDPRVSHSATTLADGRVLVCGGTGSDGKALATCELSVP